MRKAEMVGLIQSEQYHRDLTSHSSNGRPIVLSLDYNAKRTDRFQQYQLPKQAARHFCICS